MGKQIKRVLLLLHPEMDNSSYMLYNGLCKVLGNDNLDIFPYIKHYFGGIDDWYVLDDGKRGLTGKPGFVADGHQTKEKSFDEITKNIKSGYYDIVVFNNRTYAVKALDQFISALGRKKLPPLVVFEGEDYSDLGTIRKLKNRYSVVASFKREYIQSEIDRKGDDLHPIYPLPFSAIIDNMAVDIEFDKKDIDVFALFGNTTTGSIGNIRENIVKKIGSSDLVKKYKIHVGIDRFSNEQEKVTWLDSNRFNIPPLMGYKEYHEHMARAKINIVTRGWGNDSIRRFEAPSYSGLVLADRLPIKTPNDFIDGQHIVYYQNDLNDLVPKIEYYLSNTEGIKERERIGKAGKEHCKSFHTTDARARQFLDRISGHI